jgi:glycerophosphoryl diester phosphodiesterase
MVGRPDYKPFKELMYAHRGLHDNASDAPENSMAAFRKAVEGGYGMELDVQLSKDGVPVIFHDFTLERMARMEVDASVEGTVTVDGAEVNLLGKTVVPAKGKVSDYTYEELQQFTLGKSGEKIPTFKELLEMVDG